MTQNKIFKMLLVTAALWVCVGGGIVFSASGGGDVGKGPGVQVMLQSSGLYFQTGSTVDKLIVSVATPEGYVKRKTFDSGTGVLFSLSLFEGIVPDGMYTYEWTALPPEPGGGKKREPGNYDNPDVMTGSGFFNVQGGLIDTSTGGKETGGIDASREHINENLYVSGRLGAGDSMTSTDTFGYEAVKIKQYNTWIKFEDSSTGLGYASNDWQITVNESTYNGANKFAIDDLTGGNTPFTILAGAPDNSLFVDAYGEVGIGTATPARPLHIREFDSPVIRLDNAGGTYGEQVWDIHGGGTFGITDVTNSSSSPFVINGGAPEYSFTIRNNGNIGFGTLFPIYPLHFIRSGQNAVVHMERSGGAAYQMIASTSSVYVGSRTNHDLHLTTNGYSRLTVKNNGNVGIGFTVPSYRLHVSGGAYCNGTTWVNASSRELKENIRSLTAEEATDALKKLNPVKFNYKEIGDDEFLGFIAEDAPELVATKDRKGMSSMDVVALLTRVVQRQQEELEKQKAVNQELRKAIAELKERK